MSTALQYIGIRTRASAVLVDQLRQILPFPHGAEAAAFRIERALAQSKLLSVRATKDRHDADLKFSRMMAEMRKQRKA